MLVILALSLLFSIAGSDSPLDDNPSPTVGLVGTYNALEAELSAQTWSSFPRDRARTWHAGSHESLQTESPLPFDSGHASNAKMGSLSAQLGRRWMIEEWNHLPMACV